MAKNNTILRLLIGVICVILIISLFFNLLGCFSDRTCGCSCDIGGSDSDSYLRPTDREIENFELPGKPFGGMNMNILKILNQNNINLERFGDLPIYPPSYSFVPAGMSGLEEKGVQAADTERTALMGEALMTKQNGMVEHLALKNYQTDRGWYETPEGPVSWSEGPAGMTIS